MNFWETATQGVVTIFLLKTLSFAYFCYIKWINFYDVIGKEYLTTQQRISIHYLFGLLESKDEVFSKLDKESLTALIQLRVTYQQKQLFIDEK